MTDPGNGHLRAGAAVAAVAAAAPPRADPAIPAGLPAAPAPGRPVPARHPRTGNTHAPGRLGRHWVRALARRRARRTPPARTAQQGQVTGLLAGLRRAALTAIAILVASASLVSFAESYRGLYEWAARHGPGGIWVAIWPLMVDVFIAVGELTLFVAMIDQWPARSRAGAWAVTLGGLAVSVTGNIGHVAGHSLANRGTAAVPPLAAAISLSVGMGVLKRVVAASAPEAAIAELPAARDLTGARPQPAAARGPAARTPPPSARGRKPGRSARPRSAPPAVEDVAAYFADRLASGQLPSQKQIRAQWPVGSSTAKRLREALRARAGIAAAEG